MLQNILYPKNSVEYDFDFLDDVLGLACFSVVNDTEDIKHFDNPRLQKWMLFKTFVIFGTGGSSLGGQCIKSISGGSFRKNVIFVSNLDPSSLEDVFCNIDIRETGFLCISKSGETLETISQIIIAIEKAKLSCDENRNLLQDKFIVITEDKPSTLKKIAIDYEFLCLDHPKTIGGRFSVFSIVGMLPALLCGIDPLLIRDGGKRVLKNCIAAVKDGASFITQSMQQGINQHVSFIYSDKLIPFGEWLAQLYAESTGKLGTGITPLTARGSVDQHSQLQLYMDGKNDKCFTFFLEKQDNEFCAFDESIPETFSYLSGKKLYDVFEAQCNATLTSILEKERNLRKIEVQSITPTILGELFMHFMLEVTCVCRLIGVDPFNQPAVERGKVLTKNLLGA
jgi:glucose-6-phosphate isomerase